MTAQSKRILYKTKLRAEAFAHAYLASGDIVVAAKAASSKAKDLRRAGQKWMRKPIVHEQIEVGIVALAAKYGRPVEEVRLIIQAFPMIKEFKRLQALESPSKLLH